MSKITKLHVRGAAFKDMHNLRLLKIYNSRDKFPGKRCRMYLPEGLLSLPNALRYLYWDGYPLKSLPSEFSPDNLVELYMPNSQVKRLWTEDQVHYSSFVFRRVKKLLDKFQLTSLFIFPVTESPEVEKDKSQFLQEPNQSSGHLRESD